MNRCCFCGAYYTRKFFRSPSAACDPCAFEIHAAAIAKGAAIANGTATATDVGCIENDWGGNVKKNPGYYEPEEWVLQ